VLRRCTLRYVPSARRAVSIDVQQLDTAVDDRPGDFDYGSKAGTEVLRNFEAIPDAVYTGEAELCIGEISVPINSAKQLIGTYGTYGLLYNWFPAEAQGLRKITDKPRSEFIAIGHDYLKTALVSQRWYGYEQTIVILVVARSRRSSASVIEP
jgi:hypothetical protein